MEAGISRATKSTRIVTQSIELSAEQSKNFTVNLGAENADLIIGRLYISEDPGSDTDEEIELTLYSDSDRKGEQAIYRAAPSLAYTELSSPTTGSDANFSVDDNSALEENDLIAFLDTTVDFERVESTGTPNTTEDTIGVVHGTDTGVSKVVEFGGFRVSDDDGNNQVYGKVYFSSGAVTLTLTLWIRLI